MEGPPRSGRLEGGLTGVDEPPGAPLQNCLDLYDKVTSTTPGMCLGGRLDTDGVGRDQLREPYSEEAFSSLGVRGGPCQLYNYQNGTIGPSSRNAPSELSPRLRTYSCAFRKKSANDPGCSLQERPQGIIHMKIATICLLKPAPSNSS